jgi:hypothetical protein
LYHGSERASYFGRELANFTWEKTDKAAALRRAVGLAAVV